MAIFGRAIKAPLILPSKIHQSNKWSIYTYNFRRNIFLLFLFLFIFGCTTSMEMGKPPLVDHLDRFEVNISTSDDIQAALGEPQGYGRVRSPSFGLKEIWLYESSEIDGKKVKIKMLMVFMDKEHHVYHGHLWFASGVIFE